MRQLPLPVAITRGRLFVMSKSNLLIDETPIVFQPTLAKLIGLPEAIVLQTLKFWCGQKRSGKVVDDERWIFNTLEQWREFSFPFWSTRTIGEVFRTLESMGLVKSKQFDLQAGKAMKYYTISQSALTLLTSERADHLEDSSTSIWKILPDHVEDSSRSARARHIKQYTEKQTEKQKPLTPLQGEEESSAVASHSSTQTNLFPTNPSEANASGSATAKLKSADGKETAPHCAAPPRTRKSREPKLVDEKFIAELQRLNPDKDVEREVKAAQTWLLSRPDRKYTRGFLANWVIRSKNIINPDKFHNNNSF
jgi:DNA-binding PadR family transcriptional regulator